MGCPVVFTSIELLWEGTGGMASTGAVTGSAGAMPEEIVWAFQQGERRGPIRCTTQVQMDTFERGCRQRIILGQFFGD